MGHASAATGTWRRVGLWGPVVAYMAIIFAVSAMSAPPSPVAVGDKVEHFVAYAAMGALLLRATSGGRLDGLTVMSALAAWVIATLYGVSDEYHQSFVPGRSPDVNDVAADSLGAALAVVALWASGIIARSRGAVRSR